jgi:hypothetical protein
VIPQLRDCSKDWQLVYRILECLNAKGSSFTGFCVEVTFNVKSTPLIRLQDYYLFYWARSYNTKGTTCDVPNEALPQHSSFPLLPIHLTAALLPPLALSRLTFPISIALGFLSIRDPAHPKRERAWPVGRGMDLREYGGRACGERGGNGSLRRICQRVGGVET